ncbi:MAG: HAD family hydrolase [Ignavibacteriae bacterium]|nr:MAG: HAD family hydrolase [Ignavibacteriota bacterium]
MKALFLDRDGIINKRIVGGYVRTIDEFHLLDDILPVLRRAHDHGYKLILITNQQGVGKGLMSREQLDVIHQHMQHLLHERLGFALDAIYDCTSLASDNDPRRKPEPGMLLEAITDHHLDPAQCWFIGDSISDAQAGRAAGVKTMLVGEFEERDADRVFVDLRNVDKHLF